MACNCKKKGNMAPAPKPKDTSKDSVKNPQEKVDKK